VRTKTTRPFIIGDLTQVICPEVSRCRIISAMGLRSTFFPFLMLCLLTFRLTPQQNAEQIKAWTERHARYMSQPRIEETESLLEITANAPRPLDDVLAALAHQHGWHINYEEPQYGKSDIVDSTAPSWLEQHPNGPRAYGIAGGAFHVKISIDGYFPDDAMQILPHWSKLTIAAAIPAGFNCAW
jgi:hypothetical protein